jgi:hypothetical protein
MGCWNQQIVTKSSRTFSRLWQRAEHIDGKSCPVTLKQDGVRNWDKIKQSEPKRRKSRGSNKRPKWEPSSTWLLRLSSGLWANLHTSSFPPVFLKVMVNVTFHLIKKRCATKNNWAAKCLCLNQESWFYLFASNCLLLFWHSHHQTGRLHFFLSTPTMSKRLYITAASKNIH